MEKLVLRNFKILFAVSLLALTACSVDGLEPVYGIDSNTVVNGTFQQKDNAKISGSGRVRFDAALPTASSRSMALKASLDQTIGDSSVTAVFYSSSLGIPDGNGIAITFSRTGAAVNARVSFNGTVRTVNASRLNYLFPASLDLIVEVHNVNSQARLLVWRRDVVGYTAATADIDTERSGDLTSSPPISNGGGGFAGLILANATVSGAAISTQKIID